MRLCPAWAGTTSRETVTTCCSTKRPPISAATSRRRRRATWVRATKPGRTMSPPGARSASTAAVLRIAEWAPGAYDRVSEKGLQHGEIHSGLGEGVAERVPQRVVGHHPGFAWGDCSAFTACTGSRCSRSRCQLGRPRPAAAIGSVRRLTLVTVGVLRRAGLQVEATGRNPHHFTVGFSSLDGGIETMCACEYRTSDNPYHEE